MPVRLQAPLDHAIYSPAAIRQVSDEFRTTGAINLVTSATSSFLSIHTLSEAGPQAAFEFLNRLLVVSVEMAS
jgi:hypothetical protein